MAKSSYNSLKPTNYKTSDNINEVHNRVTIRPGFSGHVLFFGLCPGAFSEIGGVSGFLAQSASTFERCQLQRRTTA